MVVLLVFFLAVGVCSAYPELNCNGPNEVATKCASLCPQFCNISYTEYECDEKCRPGCDCKENYLRNLDGKCVHYDLCEEPFLIPECEKGEVVVPCAEACSKTLCSLFPLYEYLCVKKMNDDLDADFEDENESIYECPIGYDPNNIPSILISNLESTLIGVDYPHPTKYKRPELLEISNSVTYLAPFIKKDEDVKKSIN